MIRNIIILSLLLLGSTAAWAQTTGSLQGKIIDSDSEEGLAFANVKLEQEGSLILGTVTDFDGNYNFSNIEAGTYDLVIEYIGYNTKKLSGLLIIVGKNSTKDVVVSAGVEIEIVTVKPELDVVSTIKDIPIEDIKHSPTRGVDDFKTRIAGINAPDVGEASSTNGARTTSNDMYIDGVRVNGRVAISDVEIAQMQVITNGMPAEYGDATGSITNIITKGPSAKLHGGVQVESSQFLDNFGENRVNAYLSGPIFSKTMFTALGDTLFEKGQVKKQTILGYRFSGTYFTTLDNRPSALPTFKLKDHKLQEILNNPLVANPKSWICSPEGNVIKLRLKTCYNLAQGIALGLRYEIHSS